MAKARRQGGSQFSEPNRRLPLPGDIDDGLEDLPGPGRASVVRLEPPRLERLPVRQVLTVHKRQRVRNSLARAKLILSMPSAVRFCFSRSVRREVLFALRRAGYSGSAKKRHWRRSVSSQWRC